ncbi:DUF3592 domain-containing protein [Alcaligenaceae bacterium]|nr:DUF3592 domain-containing protein [Alcaligenaceae bacterium]
MALISKIKTVFDSLKTNWSSDPAARGAAKMAMGAAFLAEGIFGFVRGSRSSTSLVGSMFLAVGAFVFITVGVYMSPDDYPDAMSTQGKVSEVARVRDSDGKHAYSPVYSYVVSDKTYTLPSSITTNKRPTLGSPVKIVYSASEPLNAYREDGAEGWFSWIFLGSGMFLALWAAYSLLVSIALLVVGIILFRGGRKDRATADHTAGFVQDLISLVSQARQPK